MDLKLKSRLTVAAVVAARLIVGATFIMSGFVKSIDLWGFIYKMEEYFAVWGMDIPRALTLAASGLLSGAEFVLGGLLLLGCYRRASAWLLLAVMAGMLPLSVYIYFADPVSDCGCFGDFLIISNLATMLKNVGLTLLLIYLVIYNRRVAGLYSSYAQWMTGAVLTAFILFVAATGYMMQPMIDFRGYPVGSSLIVEETDGDDDEAVYMFEYTRDGETRSFTVDQLPDSTWTFAGRRLVAGSEHTDDGFAIIDGDETVTADVIADEGPQLLVVVPQPERMGHVYDLRIEQLNRAVEAAGGSLLMVMAADDATVSDWKEMSDADYEIYKAEPTSIKELARGNGALVALSDGRIMWKRTLNSLPASWSGNPVVTLEPPLRSWLVKGLLALAVLLLAIAGVDRFGNFLFTPRKPAKSSEK